ncbi:hypothetical protein QR680_009094 [Steinernema hermaphroditum]|uniref:Uncharacterized protein n=1 Tax=Steinernema hermaphroditum TaxID=289476 RepID=A0AA39IJ04_9BILA|nr:hypothetical protein QR680_009094 [Steinernema hermaphroditum]
MLHLWHPRIIFFIGLFANTVVYGFNRVNTFAFTAEQYRPDQKKEHDNAITYFFVMVNVGATFSMIGTPILRNVIGCLGKPTCYALPWSVVFIAVVISLLLFMFCLGAVNKKQVREENSMVRVYKCLRGAINSDENETKEECLAKNPGTISLKDYEDDDKIGPLGMCLDNSYPRFSRRFIFDVRQAYIKVAESSLSHMIKSLIYTILLIVDFFLFVWAVYDQSNPAATVSIKPNESKDPEGIFRGMHVEPE